MKLLLLTLQPCTVHPNLAPARVAFPANHRLGSLIHLRYLRTACHAAPPTEEAPSESYDAEEVVERAADTLRRAREALSEVQRQATTSSRASAPAFIPSTLTFGAPLSEQRKEGSMDSSVPPPDDSPFSRGSYDSASGSFDKLPSTARNADAPSTSERARPEGSGSGPLGGSAAPPWGGDLKSGESSVSSGQGDSSGSFTMQLQRQPIRKSSGQPSLLFKEPSAQQELVLISQAAQDAEAAKQAELPPLQSLLDLTAAHLPPSQQGAAEGDAEVEEVGMRAESALGHMLEDGSGTLADGSTWERISGEETGDNGYWCRWWVLRGTALGGKVEWEETWWESSDWSGMREMGAQKVGCNVSGDAWREAWTEKIYYVAESGEPCVERDAHKWASDAVRGEEWEEKWGEHYGGAGAVNKWAEKWGKRGDDVWHEKWGEDYAKGGNACLKWTDRWSESMQSDGRRVYMGDKWREDFGQGSGNKNGETWHVDADGNRYQRWWGENHFGDGWVQKFGHSTSGEHWDSTEQSGTYYNPNPHFNFDMALAHSPDLLRIPTRPRESTPEDFDQGGLDSF